MRFTKMHGIGNDYVYVNCFEQRVDDPAALAVQISDRHKGVGSDGLILVLPATSSQNDSPQTVNKLREKGKSAHRDGGPQVRMRMFNADGSEAEMCGNGIRCLCKLAHDHGITDANPMHVQTASGILSLQYRTGSDGKVDQVTVDMGPPVLEPVKIPVCISKLPRIVDYSIKTLVQWPQGQWDKECGLDQRMTCVSMGNPHAVLFCNDVAKVPLERVGPVLETHPVFTNRINVHFVEAQSPTEVTMRTWERGSGVTLACGTGACAVCVAGALTNRTGRKITAHLPGGDLDLEWQARNDHVYMTGPATEVYNGTWPNKG